MWPHSLRVYMDMVDFGVTLITSNVVCMLLFCHNSQLHHKYARLLSRGHNPPCLTSGLITHPQCQLGWHWGGHERPMDPAGSMGRGAPGPLGQVPNGYMAQMAQMGHFGHLGTWPSGPGASIWVPRPMDPTGSMGRGAPGPLGQVPNGYMAQMAQMGHFGHLGVPRPKWPKWAILGIWA